MEVLCFCSYPIEAAATRYRLTQFVSPLAEKGINLTISPFLTSSGFAEFHSPGKILTKAVSTISQIKTRIAEGLTLGKYDLILIQREAMLFGPPFFEWLAKKRNKVPLLLDLDDATYIPYRSPTYGSFAHSLKFFGKTDKIIDWSNAVICGNRFIAEYVGGRNKKAVIIPTVVDTDIFHPMREKKAEKPITIGWIGTHSTFPSIEWLFPVLSDLAKSYDFVLKLVGTGKKDIRVENVRVENLVWNLDREVADFQSLDIGLYPVIESKSGNNEWNLGKSGFKAIQYLSLGIPYVVTPIGVNAEIGITNQTHFSAIDYDTWYKALEKLLQSSDKRLEMGRKAREYALSNYTIPQQTDKLEKIIRDTVKEFKNRS